MATLEFDSVFFVHPLFIYSCQAVRIIDDAGTDSGMDFNESRNLDNILFIRQYLINQSSDGKNYFICFGLFPAASLVLTLYFLGVPHVKTGQEISSNVTFNRCVQLVFVSAVSACPIRVECEWKILGLFSSKVLLDSFPSRTMTSTFTLISGKHSLRDQETLFWGISYLISQIVL